MYAVKADIHGKVQMVGFRYSAARFAKRRGVYGWVTNNPDGTVTIWAEGDSSSVEAMVDWMHKGPPSARVDSVDLREQQTTGQYHDFTIEH